MFNTGLLGDFNKKRRIYSKLENIILKVEAVEGMLFIIQ